MFQLLRRWFRKIPALPGVEFCSSCWRRFEESKPWVETWKDLKFCRDCLCAMHHQLQASAVNRDPTRLVILPYPENPYQPTDALCLMCGLVPTVRTAVLYNKTHVCGRCVRVALQLLEESDGSERVRF